MTLRPDARDALLNADTRDMALHPDASNTTFHPAIHDTALYPAMQMPVTQPTMQTPVTQRTMQMCFLSFQPPASLIPDLELNAGAAIHSHPGRGNPQCLTSDTHF